MRRLAVSGRGARSRRECSPRGVRRSKSPRARGRPSRCSRPGVPAAPASRYFRPGAPEHRRWDDPGMPDAAKAERLHRPGRVPADDPSARPSGTAGLVREAILGNPGEGLLGRHGSLIVAVVLACYMAASIGLASWDIAVPFAIVPLVFAALALRALPGIAVAVATFGTVVVAEYIAAAPDSVAVEVVELAAFAVVGLALRLVVVRLTRGREEIDHTAATLAATRAQVDEARDATERWVSQLEVVQRAAARMAGRASVREVAEAVADEIRVDRRLPRLPGLHARGAGRPGGGGGGRRERLRGDLARRPGPQGGRRVHRLGRCERPPAAGARRERRPARHDDPRDRRDRRVDGARPDALRRAGHGRPRPLEAGPSPVRPGRRPGPLDPCRPGGHRRRIGEGDRRLDRAGRGPATHRRHEQRPLAQPGSTPGRRPHRQPRGTGLRRRRVRDLLLGSTRRPAPDVGLLADPSDGGSRGVVRPRRVPRDAAGPRDADPRDDRHRRSRRRPGGGGPAAARWPADTRDGPARRQGRDDRPRRAVRPGQPSARGAADRPRAGHGQRGRDGARERSAVRDDPRPGGPGPAHGLLQPPLPARAARRGDPAGPAIAERRWRS